MIIQWMKIKQGKWLLGNITDIYLEYLKFKFGEDGLKKHINEADGLLTKMEKALDTNDVLVETTLNNISIKVLEIVFDKI